MIRMIFSTVRAPQEPALTVESLAIRQHRPAVDAWRCPVITPSAGSPSASALAKQPVLHKGALVDQQRDPLAGEQLALGGVGRVVALRPAGQHPLAQLPPQRPHQRPLPPPTSLSLTLTIVRLPL